MASHCYAAYLLPEALKTAETIASMAPLAAIANNQMVIAAFENGLALGILFERRTGSACWRRKSSLSPALGGRAMRAPRSRS